MGAPLKAKSDYVQELIPELGFEGIWKRFSEREAELALGSVWECVFKKIICVFKPNRNFGVFGIAILKTQILKLWKNLRFQ
jgi:hypothetical protein